MFRYATAIIQGMNQVEAILDKYGNDGWELSTTTQLFYEQSALAGGGLKPGPIMMVFKKEKTAEEVIDPEEGTEDDRAVQQ